MKSEDIKLAVDSVLRDWAEWHRTQEIDEIGFPSKSAGFLNGGLKSFDDLCERVSNTKMQSIDSCVQSLPPAQAAAIERAYGLCVVYRFPRGNYLESLDNAMVALSVSFRAKGVEL
jgi:hypothetical protein